MTDALSPGLVAEAVRRLYGAAPEDFVPVRAALVKQAKLAKDKAAADAIGGLRKPTRSAHALNQLARQRPAAVTDLLHLGSELRRAQRTADAPLLRELTARRRELVSELVLLGAGLVGDRSNGTKEEMVQTLNAALVDDDVALGLQSGTLTKAGSWDGFGPAVAAQLAGRPTPPPPLAASEPLAVEPVAVEPTAVEPTAPSSPPRLRLVQPLSTEPADSGPPPTPSPRQEADAARIRDRLELRSDQEQRRGLAHVELVELADRQAAGRARRRKEAIAEAQRRLHQATTTHRLATQTQAELAAEIKATERRLESLQDEHDEHQTVVDRTERALRRAEAEVARAEQEPT